MVDGGRDRARARAHLGRGFPSCSFEITMMGSQFCHTPRFPGPPCDHGRSDFPSPVLTSACPFTVGPQLRKLKRWRVYAPLGCGLLMNLAPFLRVRETPALSPGPDPGAAERPGLLRTQSVLPKCAAASCAASLGVTPPSSLIWTHAPDQIPPTDFGCP